MGVTIEAQILLHLACLCSHPHGHTAQVAPQNPRSSLCSSTVRPSCAAAAGSTGLSLTAGAPPAPQPLPSPGRPRRAAVPGYPRHGALVVPAILRHPCVCFRLSSDQNEMFMVNCGHLNPSILRNTDREWFSVCPGPAAAAPGACRNLWDCGGGHTVMEHNVAHLAFIECY